MGGTIVGPFSGGLVFKPYKFELILNGLIYTDLATGFRRIILVLED